MRGRDGDQFALGSSGGALCQDGPVRRGQRETRDCDDQWGSLSM